MFSKNFFFALVTVMLFAIAAFAFYGLANLDRIIKQTIEQNGSQTTQTAVTLEKVNLSLRSGEGQLHGLQINNPTGFSTPYAFLMKQVAIQIDPETVLENVVVIKHIKIDGARLVAEQKNLKDLNLYELGKNVKNAKSTKSDKTASSPADKTAPTTTPTTTPKVRLMIEKIILSNISLQLVTEHFGNKTLTLPTIELTNIGDKQKGLAPDELGKAIMKPLMAKVIKAAKGQIKRLATDQAKAKAREKLKSLFGK